MPTLWNKQSNEIKTSKSLNAFKKTNKIVATVLVPFQIVDNFTEQLSGFLISHVRLVLGGAVTLFLLNMMYYFGPLQQMLDCLRTVFVFIYEALGYFNAVWVSRHSRVYSVSFVSRCGDISTSPTSFCCLFSVLPKACFCSVYFVVQTKQLTVHVIIKNKERNRKSVLINNTFQLVISTRMSDTVIL